MQRLQRIFGAYGMGQPPTDLQLLYSSEQIYISLPRAPEDAQAREGGRAHEDMVSCSTSSSMWQPCLQDLTKITLQKIVFFLKNKADLIPVMRDGKIAQSGDYTGILKPGEELMELVRSHKDVLSTLKTFWIVVLTVLIVYLTLVATGDASILSIAELVLPSISFFFTHITFLCLNLLILCVIETEHEMQIK